MARYRRSLVSLLALVSLVLITACPSHVRPQERNEETQSEIDKAQQLVAKGKPDEAVRTLDALGADVQRDESAVAARFQAAELYYKHGNYAAASGNYQRLLALAPEYRYADAARYHQGMSDLALGHSQAAYGTLEPLYARLPTSEQPTAADALSRAAERTGRIGDAARWQITRLGLAQAAHDGLGETNATARANALISSAPLSDLEALAQTTPQSSPVRPMLDQRLSILRPPAGVTAPPAPTKPDTIGALLPLSGRYKNYGQSVLEGIKLALQGSSVQLRVVDSAADPAKAAQAITNLVQTENVIAIIGPVVPAESQAAAIQAQREGVPLITLTIAEGLHQPDSMTFQNMATWSSQARALARYAVKTRGLKKFATLAPVNPYGSGMAEQFKVAIEAQGGTLTQQESYPEKTVNFRGPVGKLVGGGSGRPGFDAVFIPDNAKNVSQLAPFFAAAGVNPPATCGGKLSGRTVLMLGASVWNRPELVERAQKYVKCAVIVDAFFLASERPQTHSFVDSFQTTYSRPPNLLSASGFDSATMLRQAIETRGPKTRLDMRVALLDTKNFVGATGPTRFLPNGEVEKGLFLLTVDDNGIRELVPEPKS